METRGRRQKEKEQKEDEDFSFVKSVKFRANRGTRMKSLLEKKGSDKDTDLFWKSNKYFGSNLSLFWNK